MNSSSRTPPRFVPTLTEVVPALVDPDMDALGATDAERQVPDPLPADAAAPASHSPWLTDGLPVARGLVSIPRDLPPLPDSLPPQQFLSHSHLRHADVPEAGSAAEGAATESASASAELAARASFEEKSIVLHVPSQLSEEAEERLVQRLMQHVDRLLEQRLREAISAVVEKQACSMARQLHEEVVSVVRQSVRDAVEQELPMASVEPPGLDSGGPKW
jgi:hypothetical protein